MVKEISIAKLKKELLLAKETIAALSQERDLIEEKLIIKEEVSDYHRKVLTIFKQLNERGKDAIDVQELRLNLEKTINREKEKARVEEREDNIKEFQKIAEL